jgi:two-component sensor histidine kinase
MLFIKSFPCDLKETEAISEWLKEVSQSLEGFSYNRLRLIIHEAFVNACKHALDNSSHIVVILNKIGDLEIIITDPGSGFVMPNALQPFDLRSVGQSWVIAEIENVSVQAEMVDPSRIRFNLVDNAKLNAELKESQRGLVSILKCAKALNYHFMPNSFNYFKITC